MQVDIYHEGALVSFLCDIADSSERPKSALSCAGAALSHMFNAFGQGNPSNDPYVRSFITALIKSSTRAARERSGVIPVAPLRNLFLNWPPSTQLDIKRLRLKCITLMALALMLRPSDIAPKAVLYSPSTGVSSTMVFGRDQVQFKADGTASITLHGIKNDSDRAGFIVCLTPSSIEAVCPVRTLQEYLKRTQPQVTDPDRPVFLTLKRPYKALSAQTIAHVLNESLQLCDLYPLYSAKDFRPTGATLQVQEGVAPKTVMKVGR